MHKESAQATQEEQQAAILAAGAAARVLLSALPQSDQDLDIAEKADGSLVSSADLASQSAIQAVLAPLGVPMLSQTTLALFQRVRKEQRSLYIRRRFAMAMILERRLVMALR